MARTKFSTVDDYISQAPKEVRALLKKIKKEIKHRVPSATEVISYNIPAFQDPKPFIFFASFKTHIGVYPPLRDKKLIKKLKPYMNAKGNLAFPLDEEVPIKVIGDLAYSYWKNRKK